MADSLNLLSVAIPLLVRRVIDELKDGFSLADVLAKAGLIVALATLMGGVRLLSRLLGRCRSSTCGCGSSFSV